MLTKISSMLDVMANRLEPKVAGNYRDTFTDGDYSVNVDPDLLKQMESIVGKKIHATVYPDKTQGFIPTTGGETKPAILEKIMGLPGFEGITLDGHFLFSKKSL